MMPTLSVIVPNYNHAILLERCVSALLAQSRPADEIIIIDDASTDGSRAVIERLAAAHPVIKPVFNAQNLGVVGTIEDGLSLAQGDFLYFAASDDYALPGLFERLMALAATDPALGVISADPASVQVGQESQEERVAPLPLAGAACLTGPQLAEAMRKKLFFLASHVCFLNREAAIASGGFPAQLKWHCDWFLIHTLAFRHGLAYSPGAGAVMQLAPTTYSARNTRQWSQQKAVLITLVDLLISPTCRDVVACYEHSSLCAQFGMDFVRMAQSYPPARRFLTVPFFRAVAAEACWAALSGVTPERLKRWRHRRRGTSLDRRSGVPISSPKV